MTVSRSLPGGEVVRLAERADAPSVYDVKVDCKVQAHARDDRAPSRPTARSGGHPAYRESWDRTFAPSPCPRSPAPYPSRKTLLSSRRR